MNYKTVLTFICCLSTLVACIGSKSPAGTTPPSGAENTGPEGFLTREISVAGYGYARSANKKLVETFARNYAAASLVQQAAGYSFRFNPVTAELTLEAAGEALLQGESRPAEFRIFQRDNEWEAFALYSSETTISCSPDSLIYEVEVSFILDDKQNLLLEGAKASLLEYLAGREDPAGPDAGEEIFSGVFYLEELNLEFKAEVVEALVRCLLIF